MKVWIDAGNGRFPKLDRAFCAAVMDEARRLGKITMAHIVTYDDAKMIVDEGVNILAHNVRDAVIDDDFVAKLKARNVTVISTLAREEAMFVFADAPAFIDTPFFQKGLSPERLVRCCVTTKRDEQKSGPATSVLSARLRDRQDSIGRSSSMPVCAWRSAPIPAATRTASSSRASSSTARWS